MKDFFANMGVKAKLVWMLILMSAIPLAIFIAISSYNMFTTAISSAEVDSEKRSQLVEENIDALFKENFTGMRTLASNPLTHAFLADPVTQLAIMQEAVGNANKIFKDDNPTHVTNVKGQQLIRSDNLPVAEISSRAYFKAAMQGKESISEVVTSKATGRAITVLAIPVVSQDGKVAGMLQRDYDLSVLQKFVKNQSDDNTQVFLVDKEGKLLAHSAKKVETEADRVDETGYSFVKKALAGESGIATADIEGEKRLVSYRQNPQTGWVVVTALPYSIVWKQSVMHALAFSGIGIILLFVFSWLAFLLAGKFVKPLLKMVDAASCIAQGNLVVEKLDISSKDEIGQLAAAFNAMILQLKNLVQQITANAEQIAASSEELTANAEQSAQASNQVASSITEMAAGATVQMDAANETSAIVERMSAGIQQISANANQLSDHSAHAADKAKNGDQAVEKAVQQMNKIEDTVNSSAKVVVKLGKQSKEIGEIVDTIAGIAGQTNLLALNAAIEAARAGEQGRGFAVVAEEVRKLAEQSQEAAKKIAELIGKIQGDTDDAVVAMNEGTQEVKIGAEVVNAAGAAFREIMNVVEQVSDQVREISAAIQQMATGSQQIVNSVKKIDDLSKKSAGEAQGVSAATEEQLASMEEIASSSQALANLAQNLQTAVAKFQV